ncbi:hypothetical protein VTO42DRAFT_4015 [Malbranchea cinnamomea]
MEDDDRFFAGSQDMTSDDGDEIMRDADEIERDADPESPSSSSVASESQTQGTQPNPEPVAEAPTSNQSSLFRPTVRPEALTARTYDIVPTTAAPHSTSVNAVTATADMRWVFSGGSDGYIRKFNWVDSINGKLMLTVAQRHPFVDSVVKAGVLMTYWENMDRNGLSPVYSLAAQAEGLWLLSGLQSGGIRLQSVRHDEGREIALLQKHTSAVSVLRLTSDEQSLLSGSWDKTVLDWDLNTGQTRRSFVASLGQISAIQIRPESSLPVPSESEERHLINGHSSSSNRLADSSSFVTSNSHQEAQNGTESGQQAPSPTDSLFGGGDSLFGDDDATGENEAPLGGEFPVAEHEEFSQALPNGISQPEAPSQCGTGLSSAADGAEKTETVTEEGTNSATADQQPPSSPRAAVNGTTEPLTNGLPHAEELPASSAEFTQDAGQDSSADITSDTTFLAASIDGTIRVWDRRQPGPIARIVSQNAPPWCMSACWSPDGNYIYAGRRNGTVEEYSLHKGFRSPERIFKLPSGSGAVSEIKAMPNGRHLICASHDILRLYDLKEDHQSKSSVPFLIIPGHRTGTVSQLYLDPACRFLISTGGNRGWEGISTEVLLGYEINIA